MRKARKVFYCCHHCGKSGWVFPSRIFTQALTGRQFCSLVCANNHLKFKGLA